MKYNLIIWDFNGTICDDVTLGIECINRVLERRNMKTVPDKEAYRKLFCFPIIEYYKKLGFDFSSEPYEIPANEWTAEYLKNEKKLKLNDGVVEVLNYVHQSNTPQIVLSTSEITMLERELEFLGVSDFFDTVLGIDNTFGGGKIALAKEWMKNRSFNALFIGDTLHDFETSKAIGADCVLYSRGHDLKEKLLASGVPVVDDIRSVISYM